MENIQKSSFKYREIFQLTYFPNQIKNLAITFIFSSIHEVEKYFSAHMQNFHNLSCH